MWLVQPERRFSKHQTNLDLGIGMKDDELEICEGVAGVWHYHLRKKGESRALCRAFVMPTKIPLSQWNRKIPDHHIPESYCKKCDALKDK